MYNFHDSTVYLYFFIILANKVACLLACCCYLLFANNIFMLIIIRHHALNELVARAFGSAGIPVTKEPNGLSRSDGKRPDGLSLIPWHEGKPLCWDVMGCDPSGQVGNYVALLLQIYFSICAPKRITSRHMGHIPLLGCDGHMPTGQLLLAVCNRLRRCCCRVGRHSQGREIQHTGRPIHLPAHCCGVTWSNELGGPQVPGRPRSEDLARVWRRQGNYVFVSTHFCFVVSFQFCFVAQ